MDKKKQLTQMTKMPFSIDCQNEEILKNGFKIKKKNLTKPCWILFYVKTESFEKRSLLKSEAF